MKKILSLLDRLFFAPVSATGFGLMRMGWAASVFISFLTKWPDIKLYYSSAGFFTGDASSGILREDFRFSIFEFVQDPQTVFFLYLLFLLILVCTMVGLFPRLMTTLSVLLLFSFHEANPLMLGGGDTVLRNIGFLLLITPCLSAFSLRRWELQWTHWNEHRTLLPPLTMPVWPVHLLTWQLVLIYIMSIWTKLLGDSWLDGTAFVIPLYHSEFARFPGAFPALLGAISPLMSYLTLLYEVLWIFLLFPKNFFETFFFVQKKYFHRFLLIGGIIFHGSIFVVMNVGSFSYAMLAGYAGLLSMEDFSALRHMLSRKKKKISVFFDSECRLCRRATFTLLMLDLLHHLHLVDFKNEDERKKYASDIPYTSLDRSMHIRLPNGTVIHGFDAFRALSWHLPPLWIVAPLLYVPGVAPIGRFVYTRISSRRKKCTHERC